MGRPRGQKLIPEGRHEKLEREVLKLARAVERLTRRVKVLEDASTAPGPAVSLKMVPGPITEQK